MTVAKTARTDANSELRRNEKKWTKPLMEAGWTVLPSVFLERQHALGLDSVDVNIILHLAKYWWYSDNLPHPGKKKLAECMNCNVSTIRRHIARLETAGFIHRRKRTSPRDGRQETNFYALDGLIKAATPYAEELLEERKRQQAERAERHARKKPRIALVKGRGGNDD